MPGITTAFAEGVAASRPAAASSNAGYMWYSTDTQILSQSNGSSWTQIAAGVALDILSAKGDVLTRTSSGYARQAVGSDAQVLTADSTQSTGVKWATPASGFADPMTTRGDLIVRGAGGTTRLALGSSGQYLKSDGTDATWAASGSALTQISKQTLGSSAASIAFSSISGSYTSLQLMIDGRIDTTSQSLLVQFNGDTGSTYDYSAVRGNGSAASSYGAAAGTSIRVGFMAGTDAPASVSTGCDLWIPNYAGTVFQKTVRAPSLTKIANTITNFPADYIAGFWRSTAAITSILLFPAAGNFITGTVAVLYALT